MPTILKPAYFGSNPDLLQMDQPTTGIGRVRNLVSIDLATIDTMISQMKVNSATPQFKYVHFWGAHLPATLDANCNGTVAVYDRPNMSAQSACIMSRLGSYLDALRQKGIYDACQIFIVADHGTKNFPINGDRSTQGDVTWDVRSAASPMILFKDYGVSGPLAYSSEPVTHLDLKPTILNAAGVEPKTPRDLVTASGPVDREFFDHGLADEVMQPVIHLQHYKVGPNTSDADGWAKLN